MATAAPRDTQQYHRGGRVGDGGAGRSAEGLRQNPYVNRFCYCVCVFLGEGGRHICVHRCFKRY